MFMCSKCGEKDVPRRGKRSDCKKCEREYQREWKKNNPEKQKEYNGKSNATPRVKKVKQLNVRVRQARRRHIKKLCAEYLGGECQYEGGCVYPIRDEMEICYASFDFHHLDPTVKTAEIAKIINRKLTDTVIRKIQLVEDVKKYAPALSAELDKCLLLCRNCHNRLEYCCNRGLQKISS